MEDSEFEGMTLGEEFDVKSGSNGRRFQNTKDSTEQIGRQRLQRVKDIINHNLKLNALHRSLERIRRVNGCAFQPPEED